MMLNDLILISKYAGMREDIVQAGGGNSSVKINNQEMLIKASGFQLSELSENYGYSRINYTKIEDYMKKNQNTYLTEEDSNQFLEKVVIEGKKPSIETFLHAITNKVTLHTHPTLINVLTARKNGMLVLKELFPEALFIDYFTPGIKLAQEYYKVFNNNKTSKIIFLKNHGLIVNANSAKEVIELTEQVINSIACFLHIDNKRYTATSSIYAVTSKIHGLENYIVYLSNDNSIKKYIREHSLAWSFTFCPDCIVYCGKKILSLKSIDEQCFYEFIDENGLPTIILYEGQIYILAESMKKARDIESVLRFSAEVNMLNCDYDIEWLSDEEVSFLQNWDAEKYRKSMK